MKINYKQQIIILILFQLLFLFGGVKKIGADEPGNLKRRPKIGLVLGGGGARGAAHVGVIKVLEENHVPIDYIVGTSMGAIVGGLYAAGYSPQELEKLFSEIDWNDMLTDRPTENMLSFRNKTDFQRLSNLEMGIKNGKITFPRGIIAGQKLDFMLKKLTIHTVDTPDFDNLRIPFRAVATDAATGEMVVFSSGNLASAIRASMSVPGAFPPMKYEDRLLMDGFLSKNVPVEIAKQMGADVLIVVNVSGDLMKKEDLNTLVDFTNQMFGILSKQNVDRSLQLLTDKDLLIKPDLKGIGPSDFVKTPEAVKRGESIAREEAADIKKYSISKDEFRSFIARQRIRKLEPITLDFVEVAKPKRVSEALIKGRIETKTGQQLDFDQLQRDLTSIYAIGDFETVDFNLEQKDGKKGLVINTNEKSWGPEYLRFGFNLESDIGGANNYMMVLDYRHIQLNELGGEWKIAGQVGQTFGLFTDFYQPLDVHNYFFVDPQFFYLRDFEDVYEGENRIAQYRRTELGGGLDLGVNLKTYLEARVGMRVSRINAEPEVGGASLPLFKNIQAGGLLAQLDFDQLDDHRFPRSGIKANPRLFLSGKGLGANQNYQKIDFYFGKARTFNDRNTIFISLKGGIAPDEGLTYYDKFTAGGFLNLSGLGQNQLRGDNFGVAGLVYYYKLSETRGFASKSYIGASFETGNVWDQLSDFGSDPIWGGSCFLGFDTILGPLYIGYGFAEGYEGRGFVYLGKTF